MVMMEAERNKKKKEESLDFKKGWLREVSAIPSEVMGCYQYPII